MKRLIRFKEWGQNVDILQVPDEDYIEQSDGSLEKKEYRVRTDADGNISTGNDLDDEGEIILMLGDSFVESLYVDEQKRFPSVVERQLVDNGLNLRVWNGGYSGATSLHLYINLVAKYLKFSSKIRAVLYFQPSCDSGPLHHSNSYWNQNKFFAPIIESRNNKLNSALFDSSLNFEGLYRIHRVLHGTCIEYGIPIVTVKTPSKNINWGADPLQDKIF
ncbi:SGNH/GDSL hydrolase family protein [Comamonas thiooxydans]|uniref:SGNH/GDSL hydrolase family protein n=2 Tax=Comamonas TaxID=283 RepID=UPI001038ED9D|nr:SGNH/GDSL hydrolase family protein [Comamonas thiooxydans]